MGDWPSTLLAPGLTAVSSAGPLSGLGQQLVALTKFGTVATGWPTANLAFFIPVFLELPFQPQQIAWENGASVTGNIDAGIYDQTGALLGHIGSTAQSGTSTVQVVAITTTPSVLSPGTYYWAMTASSTSTLVRATAQGKGWLECAGVEQMATALPLPSTATFAIPGQGFCPLVTVAGVATL